MNPAFFPDAVRVIVVAINPDGSVHLRAEYPGGRVLDMSHFYPASSSSVPGGDTLIIHPTDFQVPPPAADEPVVVTSPSPGARA